MNEDTRYTPATGQLPASPPSRWSIRGLVIAVVSVAAVAGLIVLVVASAPYGPATPPDTGQAATGGIARELAAVSVTAPTLPAPARTPPKISDFTVTLKIMSKKCFGSVGCNVVVEPQLTYLGAAAASLDGCDVTYTVTGDEFGVMVATAYNAGGLDFRVASTVLSTMSGKVVPAATVTGVTCR